MKRASGIGHLKPFLPGLEAVLEDPEVSELMINGPGNVWVERGGELEPIEAPALTAAALHRAAIHIARPLGLDPATRPILDARLDASRDRGSISFRERCRGALADVGIYRCVSFRDLAETHFGGHPYTTRRAVNAWTREGLAQETRATGPNGNPFKVLTLTRKGAAAIRDLAAGQGLDPGQHIRSAARLLQHAQLAHDTAIYRACGRERQRLLEQGAAIRRVRLDGELKSAVARRSESARARDGRRAADAERRRLREQRHGRERYLQQLFQRGDRNDSRSSARARPSDDGHGEPGHDRADRVGRDRSTERRGA